MKATVKQYGNHFECIGLDPLKEENGVQIYEMRYLHSIGGKEYKTEKNAIRALEKNGFEYIKVEDNQMVCAYD